MEENLEKLIEEIYDDDIVLGLGGSLTAEGLKHKKIIQQYYSFSPELARRILDTYRDHHQLGLAFFDFLNEQFSEFQRRDAEIIALLFKSLTKSDKLNLEKVRTCTTFFLNNYETLLQLNSAYLQEDLIARIPLYEGNWERSYRDLVGVVIEKEKELQTCKTSLTSLVLDHAFVVNWHDSDDVPIDLRKAALTPLLEYYLENYSLIEKFGQKMAKFFVASTGDVVRRKLKGESGGENQLELYKKYREELSAFSEAMLESIFTQFPGDVSRERLEKVIALKSNVQVLDQNKIYMIPFRSVEFFEEICRMLEQYRPLERIEKVIVQELSELERLNVYYGGPDNLCSFFSKNYGFFNQYHELMKNHRKAAEFIVELAEYVSSTTKPVQKFIDLLRENIGIIKGEYYPSDDVINQLQVEFKTGATDFTRVEKILKYMKRRECSSIQEIAQCAQMDLPDYHVQRKLGQGSFKEVFQGTNLHSQEKKALKVISLSPRAKDHLRQRNMTVDDFIKEEAIKSMKVKEIGNPHLIRVDEVRYEQNIGRYVMYEELFEETLARMIQNRAYTQGTSRDKASLLDHITQIANGLRALHEHGLVHGDLSSSNIGIKKKIMKITDFGLASSLASVAQETKEQHNMGALFTRAPELFTGEKATDRSDVWSFGIIAYAMAFGEYPSFIPLGNRPTQLGKEREAYEQEVKQMIDQTDLKSLIKNSPVDPRIKNLLYKCLVKESSSRWPMSEISNWLENPEAVIGISYSEKVDEWVQWFRDEQQQDGSMILNDKLYPQNQLPFLQAGVHYSLIIDHEENLLVGEWLLEDVSKQSYNFIAKVGGMDTFGLDFIEKSPHIHDWLRRERPVRNRSGGEQPYLHLLLEKKLEGKRGKNISFFAHPTIRPLLERIEEEKNYVFYPQEIEL